MLFFRRRVVSSNASETEVLSFVGSHNAKQFHQWRKAIQRHHTPSISNWDGFSFGCSVCTVSSSSRINASGAPARRARSIISWELRPFPISMTMALRTFSWRSSFWKRSIIHFIFFFRIIPEKESRIQKKFPLLQKEYRIVRISIPCFLTMIYNNLSTTNTTICLGTMSFGAHVDESTAYNIMSRLN